MILTKKEKQLLLDKIKKDDSVNHLQVCHLLGIHAGKAIEIIKLLAQEKEANLYIQYGHPGCEFPLTKCEANFYCEECDLTLSPHEVFPSTYYLVKSN